MTMNTEALTQDLEWLMEIDSYTWKDFYEIRRTKKGFQIWAHDMSCNEYITTCKTEAEALEEVQKVFEGFKETML